MGIKISELPPLSESSNGDVVPIVDDGDGVTKKINASKLALQAYPVGAIYISTVDTDPATIFGGVWEAFAVGQTLIGVDVGDTDFATPELTGGEKEHTLILDEIPESTGTLGLHGAEEGGYFASASGVFAGSDTINGKYGNLNYHADSQSRTSVKFNSGGGDLPHNNLQPYITTYMFKRTA